VVPRVPLESPASSELNEEEESPDADYDLEDYDSEEEKRKKKRRPPPKSNKSSGVVPTRTTRSSDAATDKPFLCTGEKIDSKYPPPPPNLLILYSHNESCAWYLWHILDLV
jgi:hypothetical protein